jgi:toxin YoeB
VRVLFTSCAWDDYLSWQKGDRKTLRRINALIADIDRNGHKGIGKPEELRHSLAGFWSRRIDQEHRLVYRIRGESVEIVACRYHYEA